MLSWRKQEQDAPPGYHAEREESTLFTGKLFSVVAIVAVAVFVLWGTIFFGRGSFVWWGFAGFLPAVAFLVFSFTLFPRNRYLILPFHFASLFGVMVMASGYTYATYLLAAPRTYTGTAAPLVLVTTLFFVFIFAAGMRPYFAFIVLPPLAAVTIALLVHDRGANLAVAHFATAWVLALAGIAASWVQERVFRNEYRMRTLAGNRKEELEQEIQQVRRLNERLGREIEERKAVETELAKRAAIDELTDVYNRRAGMEILTQSLYLAQRNSQPLSVCFVDVDDLKAVNDNFGHAEGDRLLRHVITILKKHLRKSDYVSRIGGDEFLIVLPNCAHESANYIMERIAEDLRSQDSQSPPYPVSISTGVAEYTENHDVDAEFLLREADGNMYRVKQAKKRTRKKSK